MQLGALNYSELFDMLPVSAIYVDDVPVENIFHMVKYGILLTTAPGICSSRRFRCYICIHSVPRSMHKISLNNFSSFMFLNYKITDEPKHSASVLRTQPRAI